MHFASFSLSLSLNYWASLIVAPSVTRQVIARFRDFFSQQFCAIAIGCSKTKTEKKKKKIKYKKRSPEKRKKVAKVKDKK